ncbi:hypothetical protein [Pantoea sp. ME81]|uniref:hypothetical protein n=1 Tax=Pantoea sp. ME81 TaxID=2743935 RepID=UPI0015F48F5D|nr:hypothetical protein [Pantoea sp. ME81]
MINLFDLWVQHGTPGLPEETDSFDETLQAFQKVVHSVRNFFKIRNDIDRPSISLTEEKILLNTLTEEQAQLMLSKMQLFKRKAKKPELKVKPKPEVKPIAKTVATDQPNIVDVLTEKAKGITSGDKYFTTRTQEIQERAEQIIGRSIPITIHEIVKESKASPELTDDELSTVIDMMEDCPGLVFTPRQRVSYHVETRLF